MAIWILLGKLIATYSSTKKDAAINILPFCIGMLLTYYAVAIITKGEYDSIYIISWTIFALLSPLFAYLAWMTKQSGLFPMLLRVAIVAVSILSSIALFDRLSIYDFIINGILVYVIFFQKVKR